MNDFSEEVADVLMRLEPGEVVSYGEVADEAGFPGAAPAVGHFGRSTPGRPGWRVARSAAIRASPAGRRAAG